MTYPLCLAKMAKEQRAETASPTELTESEEPTKKFDLVLDSSDDEAPEEVTFKDSKAAALRSMKNALDTARREREQLKEKRRKRQELFQEQKKRKLLPADVLEEIDSASSAKQKKSKDEAGDGQQGKEVKKRNRKRRTEKRAHARNLKGNYKVTTLREQPAMAAFQQQAAEEFIQSRLYGPGSCRTTNNELLSLQNKKGLIKGAAVQFVKKDWACQEKAKAEKLKKRWIHKQQISS